MSAVDAVDELYKQPLTDFTRARNALAKTLAGADARKVRALEKPTVVAWAVNQVFWRARAAFDRLMKAGEQLRKAQVAALQGKAADVRAASDAHRRAVADAVAQAERLAAESGSKPSSDALARTFEALSLAPSPPQPPGRLTDALQPAGFEALAGITPKKGATLHAPALPPSHHPARPEHAPRTTKEDARAIRAREAEERKREAETREAAAAARAREAELRKADAAVARAEATEKLARASWEHAHDALLEARRKRDDLKRTR